MNKLYIGSKDLLPLIKESLSKGSKLSVTVTGNSMFPLFAHERDSVVLQKSVVYKPKDIVLYLREGDVPVLHRIIKKKELGFSMCGDNQLVEEYPIKEEAVLGRVCEFERKGKVISCDNIIYRFYSFVWCLGLKHRKYLLWLGLKIKSKFRKRSR